ncbi:cytosine permease [Candidimonas humi]|uniref:Purine-cytosine permease family protein n=1 Tax=Candidimonas humi TaxID=683355 RepID=A0ABV8NW55_9BURK|nr:cytosine permease [Candidimonas humi]MBV6305893.1 cytosine permease [Candidimonas humi]
MSIPTAELPASPGPRNEALTPMPAEDRAFGWSAHASLWFSLGVGLLVMQVGAYLAPSVGTPQAMLAVLAGSVIGSGLLAWVARLGCASGLSSAGLMHLTYGRHFARLPVFINIVQLLGWTTFEIVIMREGTLAIARQAFGAALDGPWAIALYTLFWGAMLTALLAGSMITLVRRYVSRLGLPLVVLSLLWLSWQFAGRLHASGLQALWQRGGDGSMGLFAALDLVIAMPVSWLPLVADYARYGRGPGAALGGTWVGYTVANVWCYGLGVLVASVSAPGAELVGALLLAQGGLAALGLILVDELDNAYGDLYSGAVSAHSLKPAWPVRRWAILLSIAGTLLALVLPMHSLEPFLLTLSSVFVPLYGVILGRLGWGCQAWAAPQRNIDFGAAALWVAGIVCYQALALRAPQLGSALPTLVLTFVLAALTRARPDRRTAAAAQAVDQGRGTA